MLSGNGRHRRPRQAPALVVAAGVAGSAIAIPLLGASGAHAATAATWDRLADCESGGSWSANEHNGYYGGLQLSQKVWESYGGLDFAPRADLASRSQQIAVAQKVLADKGPQAWPSCALVPGLGKIAGGVGVDPGATAESASPSSSASPETSGGSGGSDDSGTASDKPEASGSPDSSQLPDSSPSPDSSGSTDAADPAGSSTPSTGSADKNHREGDTSDNSRPADGTSAAPTESAPAESAHPSGGPTSADPAGSGRHRGGAADEGGARDSSGRHASRDQAHGEGTGETDEGDGTYKVRPGDTLWAIAGDHGVEGGWSALYERNEGIVGSDPDLIVPGQTLDLRLESGETQR
ncbi:transglycosylase family protein [Streptomyces sp. NPDC058045]|uniref:transglycosylase family protein n=1 Tax=Streptomyces sp. NPDC058045 TaxID=3346311 RepID=UPI0036ECB05E